MAEKKYVSSRFSSKDVQNALFNPHAGTVEEEEGRKVVCYTILGREDEVDKDGFPIIKDCEKAGKFYDAEDDDYTFAKCVTNGRQVTYYARRNHKNALFNPNGMFSDSSVAINKTTKQPVWPLVEVPKRAFEFYIGFLKSKNVAYLNNAQRELA